MFKHFPDVILRDGFCKWKDRGDQKSQWRSTLLHYALWLFMRAFEKRSYQIWWRSIRVWQTCHSITSNSPLHKHNAEPFFVKFPSQSATDLYDHDNILIKLSLSLSLSLFGSSRLGSRSQGSVCWNISLSRLLPDSRHYSCQLSLPPQVFAIVFIGSPGLFFSWLHSSACNSLLIAHFSLTMLAH